MKRGGRAQAGWVKSLSPFTSCLAVKWCCPSLSLFLLTPPGADFTLNLCAPEQKKKTAPPPKTTKWGGGPKKKLKTRRKSQCNAPETAKITQTHRAWAVGKRQKEEKAWPGGDICQVWVCVSAPHFAPTLNPKSPGPSPTSPASGGGCRARSGDGTHPNVDIPRVWGGGWRFCSFFLF